MKNLLSAKEIRERFNITTQTLNNWRKSGSIEFVQLNKRNFLYNIESLGVKVMIMIDDEQSFTEELKKKINEYIDYCIEKMLKKKRMEILYEMKKIVELMIEDERNE